MLRISPKIDNRSDFFLGIKLNNKITSIGTCNNFKNSYIIIAFAFQGSDPGVEMSFLHNNNTGNNDDTLTHSRKNGPAPRQYV